MGGYLLSTFLFFHGSFKRKIPCSVEGVIPVIVEGVIPVIKARVILPGHLCPPISRPSDPDGGRLLSLIARLTEASLAIARSATPAETRAELGIVLDRMLTGLGP